VKQLARVRCSRETRLAENAEECYHCLGRKNCDCVICGVLQPRKDWIKGQCRACLGTGFLCWGIEK